MREGISQNRRTTKLDPLLVVTDGALGPDPHCRDLLPADAPPAVPRPPTALGPNTTTGFTLFYARHIGA